MGLIKANNLFATGTVFSLADIEHQARAMLLRARAEADQILAEAARQADVLRANATEDGRTDGLEQGRADGRQQALVQGKAEALAEHRAKLAETIATFASVAAEVDARIIAVEQAAHGEVVKLALAIARRVTRTLAASDVTIAEANVREAVRLATSKASLRIAVNPAQREHLTSLLPELKLQWPAVQHVELVDDATLGPGGCRVVTVGGEVDADLERQLDRIEAELLPSATPSPP